MLLARARAFGAGPGDEAITVDIDSNICEVVGKAKSGATYGHDAAEPALERQHTPTPARPPHPHTRVRPTPKEEHTVSCEKSSPNMVLLWRRRSLTLPVDAGLHNLDVVAACRVHDVQYSITAQLNKELPHGPSQPGSANAGTRMISSPQRSRDGGIVGRTARSTPHQIRPASSWYHHGIETPDDDT